MKSSVKAEDMTPLEMKYIQMFHYWKRLGLMPWEYGLTPKPCIEHVKAIAAIDFMIDDSQRMDREMAEQEAAQKEGR